MDKQQTKYINIMVLRGHLQCGRKQKETSRLISQAGASVSNGGGVCKLGEAQRTGRGQGDSRGTCVLQQS